MKMEADETQGTIDLTDGVQQLEWELASDTMNQRKREKREKRKPPTPPDPGPGPDDVAELWAQNVVRLDLSDVGLLADRCQLMKAELGISGVLQGMDSRMSAVQMRNVIDIITGEGLKAAVVFPEYNTPIRVGDAWSVGPWQAFINAGLDDLVEYLWIFDEPGGHGLMSADLKGVVSAFKAKTGTPLMGQWSGEIFKQRNNAAAKFVMETCDIVSYQKLAAQWEGAALDQSVFLWQEYKDTMLESSRIVAQVAPDMPVDFGLQCIGHDTGHKRRKPTLTEFEQMVRYMVSAEVLAVRKPRSIRLQMCYSPNAQYDDSFLLMDAGEGAYRDVVKRIPEFWNKPFTA